MESGSAWKHDHGNGSLRKLLVRFLVFAVIAVAVRFSFLVAAAGESCNLGTFCFMSAPAEKKVEIIKVISMTSANKAVSTGSGSGDRFSKEWVDAVRFYPSVFHGFLGEGMLSPRSRVLCVGGIGGRDVVALKDVGVVDSVGIARKAASPLVIAGLPHRLPFEDG